MLLTSMLQFVLFVVQQAGILLGVGAQVFVLVSHLRELHTPAFHEREEQLYRGARAGRALALAAIILSGGILTFEIYVLGMYDILFAPAFVGKWVLIILAAALHISASHTTRRWTVEGAAGGVWLALLILHIVAPETGWQNLLLWAGLWALAFGALWTGASALLSATAPGAHFKKLSVPKISLPKFSLPTKAALTLPAPETEVESAPKVFTVQEYVENGIPRIRIMPRTPQEALKHFAQTI